MNLKILTISLGLTLCSAASAQSLEDRVRDLEVRMQSLEQKMEKPASVEKPKAAQTTQGWRSLKRNMTEHQVRSALGEPLRVQVTGMYTKWEYPKDAYVLFSAEGPLAAWNEPQ